MTNKWVAIHTGLPHYLDHLGVLSIWLHLPLIVTEKETLQVAQKYYPELNVSYLQLEELSLSYLASNFEVIFESGHYWAIYLQPMLKWLFNKDMRIVYCPHGNSEKCNLPVPIKKDISLIYGELMKDHLIKTKEWERLNGHVVTGNYRLAYYLEHRNFYADLLFQSIGNQLNLKRKTILYAPSWDDGEKESSFYLCERIIEELGSLYNLIIRWHPFLDEPYLIDIEKLLNQYKDTEGIVFLNEFPCIYPILDFVDGYLGDFSSIGYDFLAFEKPLYFLADPGTSLAEHGKFLDLKKNLLKQMVLTKTKEKNRRIEMYNYSFSGTIKKEEIITNLKKALSKERAI